jgi:ferrochelatase
MRSDPVIVPIGCLSDHMEVIYDLDTQARAVCEELGVKMVRAGTAGTHPAMIEMIAKMVEQDHPPCAEGCCAPPRRPAVSR